MSSNCQNKTKPCGCEDTGLTTPTPCIHDTPTCPDPDPCSEHFDSKCIVYNGTGSDCLSISEGMTAEQVLDVLINSVSNLTCLTCPANVLPADAATNVVTSPTLQWSASPSATMYDVYFGTDPNNLTLVSASQAGTSYTIPATLSLGVTYYWRVNARNDAGGTGDCPIHSFSTVGAVTCTDPMYYVLDMAQVYANKLQVPLDQALDAYLSGGQLVTDCDICCPDCEETKRYFLGGFTPFASYFPIVYNVECPPPCCISKTLSLSDAIAYENLLDGITAPPDCCTNFYQCYTDMITYIDRIPSSIVEESTISGTSLICSFLQWGIDNSIDLTTLYNTWDIIELYGLVIHCTESGTVISNAASYTTWFSYSGKTCYNQ